MDTVTDLPGTPRVAIQVGNCWLLAYTTNCIRRLAAQWEA